MSRARQAAQPRRKVRTTVPAAGPGLAPRPGPARDSRRQPAGRAGGRVISRISAPGRGSCTWRPSPAAARRKQSGTRLGRQHAAPTPLCEAIDMAARRCPYTTGGDDPPTPGRGCQYTSEQLADHLESYGTRPSVDRTGVCWAGAWAEVGGRHPQRTKEPTPMVYPTRSKAINDTASQVEPGTHDQKRLHSALGYRTPNEVEEKYRATRRAA